MMHQTTETTRGGMRAVTIVTPGVTDGAMVAAVIQFPVYGVIVGRATSPSARSS